MSSSSRWVRLRLGRTRRGRGATRLLDDRVGPGRALHDGVALVPQRLQARQIGVVAEQAAGVFERQLGSAGRSVPGRSRPAAGSSRGPRRPTPWSRHRARCRRPGRAQGPPTSHRRGEPCDSRLTRLGVLLSVAAVSERSVVAETSTTDALEEAAEQVHAIPVLRSAAAGLGSPDLLHPGPQLVRDGWRFPPGCRSARSFLPR